MFNHFVFFFNLYLCLAATIHLMVKWVIFVVLSNISGLREDGDDDDDEVDQTILIFFSLVECCNACKLVWSGSSDLFAV
jgi:hypothetical protein